MIPVREALRRLEAEGFVRIVPNKGARVAELSSDELHDVYRARMLIEEDTLRLAFPNIDAATLARARQLNDEGLQFIYADDPAVHEVHRELHVSLYRPANSPWLLRLIELLWDHCFRYRLLVMGRVAPEIHHREHDQLITYIEQGNLESAIDLLKEHIMGTAIALSNAFDSAPNGAYADRMHVSRASGR
jgi:DNA-binding GntR family transcriptional regulator